MPRETIYSVAMVQNLFAEYESGNAVTIGETTFSKATANQQPATQTPAPAPIAPVAAYTPPAGLVIPKTSEQMAAEQDARHLEAVAAAKAFGAARRGQHQATPSPKVGRPSTPHILARS